MDVGYICSQRNQKLRHYRYDIFPATRKIVRLTSNSYLQLTDMLEHEKPWSTLSIEEVCETFKAAKYPWWIAGGYALELALGKTIRTHGDIDVLVLRANHREVHQTLASWDCWAADPPGTLIPWPDKQALSLGVHDIFCRKSPEDHWCLQLMLDECEGSEWYSRRSDLIRQPISSISRITSTGIPYLAPHVILFYKAKNPEGKHQVDFEAMVDGQVRMNRLWLKNSISLIYGDSHPWLEILNDAGW